MNFLKQAAQAMYVYKIEPNRKNSLAPEIQKGSKQNDGQRA